MASAAEFWQMAPGQVWWLIEDMMPDEALRRGKNMAEVVEMFKAAKSKEKAGA